MKCINSTYIGEPVYLRRQLDISSKVLERFRLHFIVFLECKFSDRFNVLPRTMGL